MQAHDQEEMFMGHNQVGWSGCLVAKIAKKKFAQFWWQSAELLQSARLLHFQSRESPKSWRALQSYNAPGDWARELSKPSTDSASLVVKIEKNIFRFRWRDFWRWRHKEGIFWKFKPRLAGPGPQPIDPLFWLKICWKLGQNPRL